MLNYTLSFFYESQIDTQILKKQLTMDKTSPKQAFKTQILSEILFNNVIVNLL